MVAITSRSNYAKIKDSPSTRDKTRRIYNYIKEHGPVTIRDISDGLGIENGFENGVVSARCKELKDSLRIKEKGYKSSPITGLAVNCLVVAR